MRTHMIRNNRIIHQTSTSGTRLRRSIFLAYVHIILHTIKDAKTIRRKEQPWHLAGLSFLGFRLFPLVESSASVNNCQRIWKPPQSLHDCERWEKAFP